MEPQRPDADDRDVPLSFTFLLCSERSGSNLITKLMDAHPEVCGPSPTHLFRTFAPNLWRYGSVPEDAGWEALCRDVADYLVSQLGVWSTSCTYEELLAVEGRSLGGLLRHVYLKEATAHDADHVFVKENHAARLLPFFLTEFPQSTFLFMVRDPRDMALSLKRSAATRGSVRRGAELWLSDQQENLNAFGMLEPSGRIRLARYEDLISDAEAVLGSICRMMGLEYSSAMLRFNERDLTKANAARVDAWQNLSRPIIEDNSGGYVDGLTELETRFVESLCGVEMDCLGYTRDYEPGPVDELTSAIEHHEATQTELGLDVLSDEERETRRVRLDIIDRVLSRDLWTR